MQHIHGGGRHPQQRILIVCRTEQPFGNHLADNCLDVSFAQMLQASIGFVIRYSVFAQLCAGFSGQHPGNDIDAVTLAYFQNAFDDFGCFFCNIGFFVFPCTVQAVFTSVFSCFAKIP